MSKILKVFHSFGKHIVLGGQVCKYEHLHCVNIITVQYSTHTIQLLFVTVLLYL